MMQGLLLQHDRSSARRNERRNTPALQLAAHWLLHPHDSEARCVLVVANARLRLTLPMMIF
jgi:hypothetical protein